MNSLYSEHRTWLHAVPAGLKLAAMAILGTALFLTDRSGVLGAAASLDEESFSQGTLEYPQYTRPREWEGRAIPEILMSGDHGRIAAWRQAQSLSLTRARRPDLLAGRTRNGDKA